jgi:signal transduction histidine kinase
LKGRWKIVVVDDGEFKKMLEKVLTEECELESLPDDAHLLETISRLSPDLVFLFMKESNSYTFSLTREIKLLSPQTMVIVVGEVKTVDIPILVFRSQAYDMINWPVSEQELKERTQNALLRKKMGATKASHDRLSFSLVHQIRNPLGAISGNVQQLLRTLDKLSEEQIEAGLRQILSNCIRVEESLNEFLSLQRGAIMARTVLNLNTLVESALSLLIYRTEQKNIRVEKCLGTRLPHIKGIGKELMEAFVNVITNAIEAMREGGRLTVETNGVEGYRGSSSKWVYVKFRDTGCGMTEEDQHRIFTPFFTTKERGVGLGLSITKEIIESHKGYIEIQSHVAKGTEFRIYLPAGE